MPHCDMELYENILKANWSQENLSNLLFIANRFADYIDGNPKHKLESRVPCLLNLGEKCPLIVQMNQCLHLMFDSSHTPMQATANLQFLPNCVQ